MAVLKHNDLKTKKGWSKVFEYYEGRPYETIIFKTGGIKNLSTGEVLNALIVENLFDEPTRHIVGVIEFGSTIQYEYFGTIIHLNISKDGNVSVLDLTPA